MRGGATARTARRRAALTGMVVALVAACGAGDDGAEPSGTTGPAPTATAAPTTGAAPAEPTCADGALGERAYVLCTAGDRPGQGLVVALHGRGSNAAEMQAATRLDRVAAAEGLAVVYPDSLDGGWGDDSFTTPGRPAGDEDVVFLDALVAALRDDERIGDGPVGVVGFSNGASMAMRYGGQRPDQVTGVVAVAGQLPRDPAAHPTGRVPLLLVYGTADPVRSHTEGIPASPSRAPGDPTPTLPTVDGLEAFVAAAGADDVRHEGPAASDADPADGTTLATERWSADGTLAVLVAVVGGGHTWPSSPAEPAGGRDFGPTSRDLDASAAAIAFLQGPDADPVADS